MKAKERGEILDQEVGFAYSQLRTTRIDVLFGDLAERKKIAARVDIPKPLR